MKDIGHIPPSAVTPSYAWEEVRLAPPGALYITSSTKSSKVYDLHFESQQLSLEFAQTRLCCKDSITSQLQQQIFMCDLMRLMGC